MTHLKISRDPPPWEVVSLVGPYMDPKTLAFASCTSKSWFQCLSSDHLWFPHCSTVFPSLTVLHNHTAASIPYNRLYSMSYIATKRLLKLPTPTLTLHSLLFAIAIESPKKGLTKTIVKPCGSLEADPNGLFRFDIDVANDDEAWTLDALNDVRVTWHVVMQGWKGVFCMMESGGGSKGGGKLAAVTDGWFSEELPSPGCCSKSVPSGLVGDFRVGVRLGERCGGGDSKVVMEKVSVGVLNVHSWRYVSVDDVLRYLQHFLC